MEHLALSSYARFQLAHGIFLAARFEDQATSMCTHRHLRLRTFSHSLRSIMSLSPSMQLEIGAFYGACSCALFIG